MAAKKAEVVNLPATASVSAFTREQIETIKNTVAKGATDSELQMLLHIAAKYDLDPLLKEIWFIKRVKKVKVGRNADGSEKWDYPRKTDGSIDYSNAETVIMTSRDGYLKAAMRDPDFDGLRSFTVCEGDEFSYDSETDHVTHRFGSKRGPILGAWAAAYHKRRRPVIVFVPFAEYNDTRSDTWKHYPSAMIQKVAEVFVLRRQFSIAGLVTREELSAIEVEAAEVMRDVTPSTERQSQQTQNQPEPQVQVQKQEVQARPTPQPAEVWSAYYSTAKAKGIDSVGDADALISLSWCYADRNPSPGVWPPVEQIPLRFVQLATSKLAKMSATEAQKALQTLVDRYANEHPPAQQKAAIQAADAPDSADEQYMGDYETFEQRAMELEEADDVPF